MTWELCSRTDQSVLATLDGRKPGARVDIRRLAPRAAQIGLALSDPAVHLVREGTALLRCKIAGWPVPAFVGRVTQRSISYDDETETLVINALDPWVQLQRAIILANGVMPSGIRSFQKYDQDMVATLRDLITGCSGNGHGIVMGALPIGPNGPGTVADDASIGTYAWTSPNNAKVQDGAEANSHVPASWVTSVESHYLKATNFGFAIPAAATIVGITAQVKCRCAHNTTTTAGNMTTNDRSVRVAKAGSYVGADRAATAEWSTTNTFREYGNAADMWGTTWTPAEVNAAGFGVGIAAKSTIITGFGIAQDYYVDYIRVLVSWTYPGGSGEVYTTPSVRAVSYPAGSSVGEAAQALVSLETAPEYELTPREAADGSLATFNAYVPRQGSDKSGSVTLKIGVDDTDNITQLSYVPAMDGMVNKHTAIGDASGTVSSGGLDYPTHPAVVAQHNASIAAYGVWETSEALAGTIELGLLTQTARAIVAANAFPLTSFSCTLDPDTGPTFGPADLWIGDTVSLSADMPDETLAITGRMQGATLTEDDNGSVDVVVSGEPEAVSAGVTTSAITVVVDAADGLVPPPADPNIVDDPCAPAGPSEPDPCPQAKKKKKPKKKKKK